jgi:hypothetical protein
MIEQVAWNKSGLLLKIHEQSTQTLQLFTETIKTESIFKGYKNAKHEGLGSDTKWSN